jgi:hypothetical protein
MKEFVGSFSGVGFYQGTLSDSETFRFSILGKMNGSFFVPAQAVTVAVTLSILWLRLCPNSALRYQVSSVLHKFLNLFQRF